MEQILADWSGIHLPLGTNSTRNVTGMDKLVLQLLPRFQFVEEGIEESQLKDAWRAAVGDFLSGQSRLVSIRNKVAEVRIMHPAVLYQLNQSKQALLAKLQEAFGKDIVDSVRFRHG